MPAISCHVRGWLGWAACAVLAGPGIAFAQTECPPYERLPVERSAPSRARPVIDGRLDDPCWETAVQTKRFVTPYGKPTQLATVARITHDERRLYIGVECTDPRPQGLVRKHRTRDSDVCRDDCVEIFIDAELDFKTYYHFLVNAGNVQRDEKGCLGASPLYRVTWNATWRSAVAVGQGKWTVEMALPLDALGIRLDKDMAIGLNICREAPRVPELSCWVPTKGGFHNPRRFATLILGRRPGASPVHLEATSVGSLGPDDAVRLTAKASNRGDRPVTLESEIRIGSDRGLRCDRQAWGTLDAGKAAERVITWRIQGSGTQNLCILTRDTRTGDMVDATNLSFFVARRLLQRCGARLPAPPWGAIWWAPSTYKLFPEQKPPEEVTDTVQVAAAANEYEAFQIVLQPRRDLSRVSVKPTPLSGKQGVIGAEHIQVFQVQYVNVQTPSDALGEQGPYPDPLVRVKAPIAAPAQTNTVLWVRVHVPSDAAPGPYEGKLFVRAQGLSAAVIPVRLRVFGFALTDETHTRTAYGLGPDWSFLGVKDRNDQQAVFEKYLQVFRDHRLSTYDPFRFHPMKHKLLGPQWRVKAGNMELVCDKLDRHYFSIFYKGNQVGTLTNTIAQFEKKGVGYKGRGLSWPGITRLKQVRIVERTCRRVVLEITGERIVSSAANRCYEITFRFAMSAGRPAFAARMVGFKNTDRIRYQLQGYFYILWPEGDNVPKTAGRHHAAWLLPGGKALGALRAPSGIRGGLPPIFVSRSVWLEPGEEHAGFGGPVVFFVGDAADTKHVQEIVTGLDARLRKGEPATLIPVQGARLETRVHQDERVVFDFADFDAAGERYLDQWKFNGFNFPAMPSEIARHKRSTPAYNRLHTKIYGQMVAHLREKGWLDKAYSYWIDEPRAEHYPFVNKGMQVLGRNCPGLARLLTEQVEEPLVGNVDIWVPLLSRYNHDRCRRRQQAGDQVWWYVCCGPRSPYPNNFIDHPAINHRIRFWMMEKYGVTGSLYWNTTYWRGEKGRLRNPWKTAAAIGPKGQFWGNGDGLLLYPACRQPSDTPVLEGPVISQRIEVIRDGLEDREYFWTLKQLVRRAKTQLATASRKKRGALESQLQEAREALQAPDRLISGLTAYVKDPQELLRQRRRLAAAIEALCRTVSE